MKPLTRLHRIIFSILLFVILAVMGVSCESGDITEDEYQIQYQRQSQLKNIYNYAIQPLCENFIENSELLEESVAVFTNLPNQEHLNAARKTWLSVLKTWKQLELYNVGAVEDSYIHFEINRWPSDIDRIETLIHSDESIDVNLIASVGSSSKGISAIEYLLFSSKNDQEVIGSFLEPSYGLQRLSFLKALVENLAIKAKTIQTIWQADQESFIGALENGISGSQSSITNAMITLTEEIIISKLGVPLGEKSGGQVDVQKLEAFRSESSLIIIQEHLKALHACYTGGFIDDSIKWGYDDYLKMIGKEDLNLKILEAFETCHDKVGAINTLSESLIQYPDKVVILQNAFSELLVLLKVDMANAIGTTVTINDNDGD